MDKYLGLTIEVLDAMGVNQQSITMDGVKITTRVSGQAGDSVITQTADSVSIDAHTFSVNANSIRLTSTTGTSLQSMGQTNVSSLSDISLTTPGSVSASGLNGVTLNGMSVSMNAMQSISMLAIGGGIAACGAAGGVQIMGSDISMTGLSVSIAAPTTAITSANLNFAAVPSPPQGSAASSSSSAGKAAAGAAKVSSGALSASGSAYGMSNGSGAGGSSGSPDTGGLLNLSASGVLSQSRSGSGTSSSGTSGSLGPLSNPLANLPANSWANYISPASLSSSMSGWLGSDPLAVGNGMYSSFTSGLASNPTPMGLLKSYNAASSQLTKAAAQSLKKQLDTVAPVMALSGGGVLVLFAGYVAVEYLSACSKVSAKIASGSLTAGDLMSFSGLGLKAIGDIAMALVKLLDTPLMGGEDDTNTIMPGLKPGDTDAVSGLMDKLIPPKETGGSPMSGTILQENSSVLATILGKIQKKKMSAPPPQGSDGSAQSGDQKNSATGKPSGSTNGSSNSMQSSTKSGSPSGAEKASTQAKPATSAPSTPPFGAPPSDVPQPSAPTGDPSATGSPGQASSQNGAPPAQSGTPPAPAGQSPSSPDTAADSAAPSAADSVPTIQSLIAKINPTVLSQMAPELTALAMKNLSKMLGPVGFLSVLHDIPGLMDLMAGNRELASLVQSLLPPGFLPSPSVGSGSQPSDGTTPVDDTGPPSESSASVPPGNSTTAASPSSSSDAVPGIGTASAGPTAPSPTAASASAAPTATSPVDGSAPSPSASDPSTGADGNLSGSSDTDLDSLLTLGGLMRNQWSLGLMNMDQVSSSLLPRGPLSSLGASNTGSTSQGGTANASQGGTANASSQPASQSPPTNPESQPQQDGGTAQGSAPASQSGSDQSSDDGGIDAAINEVFSPTIQCLGPLGIGAQGARSLIKNPLALVQSGFASLGGTFAAGLQSALSGDLSSMAKPTDAASMMNGGAGMGGGAGGGAGAGGGGGTLLDEMKKKGSLLDGDYGTQFHKVLEKTYGNPIKALSVTLNPMDTMSLMSGHVQGMMMKDRQPFEAASTFTMAAQPKTPQSDAELSSMMQYGENMLQAQQQLATFMKDLLSKSTAKMLADMKADKKSAPPVKTPPPSDTKDAATPAGPSGVTPSLPSSAPAPSGGPSTAPKVSPPFGAPPSGVAPQGFKNAK